MLSAACAPEDEGRPPVTVIVPQESGSGGTSGGAGEGGAAGTDEPPPATGTAGSLGGFVEDPPPPSCGDEVLDEGEECDDGNEEDGDGCSFDCLAEQGFDCSSGISCVRAEVCGDAVLVGAETCDDGNAEGGDGCAANCTVESEFACPEPGQPCVSSVVCGDASLSGAEACDDGNLVDGDGCSLLCELEAGYVCPLPGVRCSAVCGDGLVVPPEQCDDGDAAAPGCTPDCQLESGFACDEPGEACHPTVCGDGTAEGTEQCDDGNLAPYDGCTAACTNEPRCSEVGGAYACQAVCGDGMRFSDEEPCDDGNTRDGDGCSSTCELEPGFVCQDLATGLGDVLELPIIYRDFGSDHPHFELDPLGSPRLPGMVQAQLGPDGKPRYDPAFEFQGKPWTLDDPVGGFANNAGALTDDLQIASRFAEWFTDVPGQNETSVDVLPLSIQPDGSYQFSATGPDQFFPLAVVEPGFVDDEGTEQNFHFTSEVRQWFEFQGGEVLEFSGDDDVWVFVNGRLTVDLGGIHGELVGSIELSNDGVGSRLSVQDDVGGEPNESTIDVPVTALGVNEIVVFQAERHVTQSNYTLTLRGFNAPVTRCESECGDGVVTSDETCDDGENNGTGYGQCLVDLCIPGERCGDGEVNGPEECDNGINLDGYRTGDDDCAPGCRTPPFCGDGVVDARFNEQCDDGAEGNQGSYGGCAADCQLAPRCGDGQVDEPDETCDDGNRLNNDGCNVNCQIESEPT